jgi:hypothetical protein
MLLSFERPVAVLCPRSDGARTRLAPLPDLENCTVGQIDGYHRPFRLRAGGVDHRQDNKGIRWMPWHQESMKGVDGCDKPR